MLCEFCGLKNQFSSSIHSVNFYKLDALITLKENMHSKNSSICGQKKLTNQIKKISPQLDLD